MTRTLSPPPPPAPPPPAAPASYRSRRVKARTSLFAHGEPMVWLTGGALAVSLAMIVGLLGLVIFQGTRTFWPAAVVGVVTHEGHALMGEVTRREAYVPDEAVLEGLDPAARAAAERIMAASDGEVRRRLIRTGNFELTNAHFTWVSDFEVAQEERPEWALVLERTGEGRAWGRFYGFPVRFEIDGQVVAQTPEESWRLFREHHDEVLDRRAERRELETHDIGRINARTEAARLAARSAELEHGPGSPEHAAAVARYEAIQARSDQAFAEIRRQIEELESANARLQIVLTTADGTERPTALGEVVRAYPANRLNFFQKVGVYFSRWWEFLSDEPRDANNEGGVWPAIFGTVLMTLIMSMAVVPFGVLAALYMREYARAGATISAVRIAVNNLAGVPSIVFGVFGLGFFCYIVGGGLDQVFFEERLPNPTFGKGGLIWASLTLALLTLPVVIVATEEALAAVPGSMREGSYACGASKWQTIRRIVLPRALPGIMTGFILAMARGAGEVAPLMLVGAVKLAPELPGEINAVPPYVHVERSFMHLGFHIYDLGFQSPNSEAAKPMVFTTTLLLIALIALLNVAAVWVRSRLRRRFVSNQF